MKVLLLQPRPMNAFTTDLSLESEPYMLERFDQICGELAVETAIYDGYTAFRSFSRSLEREQPAMVLLTSVAAQQGMLHKYLLETKAWDTACITVLNAYSAPIPLRSFAFAELDYLIQGEATATWRALLQAWQTKQDLAAVPGIVLSMCGT